MGAYPACLRRKTKKIHAAKYTQRLLQCGLCSAAVRQASAVIGIHVITATDQATVMTNCLTSWTSRYVALCESDCTIHVWSSDYSNGWTYEWIHECLYAYLTDHKWMTDWLTALLSISQWKIWVRKQKLSNVTAFSTKPWWRSYVYNCQLSKRINEICSVRRCYHASE